MQETNTNTIAAAAFPLTRFAARETGILSRSIPQTQPIAKNNSNNYEYLPEAEDFDDENYGSDDYSEEEGGSIGYDIQSQIK